MESLAKVQKAYEVIQALNNNQREEILSLISDIRESQASIDRSEKVFRIAQKCTECEGVCCTSEVQKEVIDEIDYFVLLMEATKAQREAIFQALDFDSYPDCNFKYGEGCILPSLARPPVCKTFFCQDIPILRKLMPSMSLHLYIKYYRLHDALKNMGFNLGCNHISRYNDND